MLAWHWASLERAKGEPKWANVTYGSIDYQDITYYSAPKQKLSLDSLESLDPEVLRTYETLGISLQEHRTRNAGLVWP